jgi:hypothetical protein
VTQPSPEVPVGPKINPNQSLIHHVIVHRESEEYQTDFDESDGTRRSSKEFRFQIILKPHTLLFIGNPEETNVPPNDSILPVVTICVDSPKDEETKSIAQTPDIERVILERSSMAANDSSNVVNIDEPIDINLANTCDTSKIFYDY